MERNIGNGTQRRASIRAEERDAHAAYTALRSRIQGAQASLPPHLRRIAAMVLDDPDAVALHSAMEIAAQLDVRPSSLIRFAKTFDFRGFSDLQRQFRHYLIDGGAPSLVLSRPHGGAPHPAAAPQGAAWETLRLQADETVRSLENLKRGITNEDLLRAVDMIGRADRILIAGQRRSYAVASFLFYGLVRQAYRCQLLDFTLGMSQEQVSQLGARDLLVGISYTRFTSAVVELMGDAHERGVPTLAITDLLSGPLAAHADLCFATGVDRQLMLRPMAVPMVLVHTLLLVLQEQRQTDPTEGTSA